MLSWLPTLFRDLREILLFVCTKIYCCDCREVFNVHFTFSGNFEAESVSKQVKMSHADFLMACVMNVHAGRMRDHINYGVTKRDAWQTALEGQRRLINLALFFLCKKLCARIETIEQIRKKISSSCYFNQMKTSLPSSLPTFLYSQVVPGLPCLHGRDCTTPGSESGVGEWTAQSHSSTTAVLRGS